jgi:predicted DsbA family dithiol-disulfide isomerase
MKVEIWSDIVCPFCYIGKRNFENALNKFSAKEEVEVVWRSFQLDPSLKAQPGKSLHEYLAERKGFTLDHAKQMSDHVTRVAAQAGLTYHLDRAVLANTLDAHRLIHLANKYGLQDEAEERLFLAYFTEGKDLGDFQTLVQLGTEIGLQEEEVKTVLQSNAYAKEVNEDQYQAQQVGARGVPFFVFNNKYAVSGAQPDEVFSKALQKSWEEEQSVQSLETNGDFCTPEGNC